MKKLLLLLMASLLFAVSKDNILALTWENSWCVINPKDYKCRTRTIRDYSLTHFLLHGLWPKNKNYCKRKKFNPDKTIIYGIKRFMPSVKLAKHEWEKHGTCFGTDQQTYFLTAFKLTQQFNESQFLTFVRMHRGQWVSLERIRYVFGGAFGDRNKRKFQLVCKKKGGEFYITEIRLNLKGDPTKLGLQELLDNAKPFVGVKQCRGGIFY